MQSLSPLFPGLSLPQPLVIAGPCSAESEEQMLATARALADMGLRVFRAGIWKPRTHPGGFEGAGAPALEWMRQVKALTGMLTATEVATPEHVEAALDAGIDLLWIGARTSANPFATQQIADALQALKADVAVLVKNPVNADLELWIGALQRIRQAGISRLGAIHRGFSVYGQSDYRNMPLWSIPIELHRRFPELPVICDPSHIGGRRDLVEPLARQAVDMGFNGLIIECHCCPDQALSDSAQQLTPDQLGRVLACLKPRNVAESGMLEPLREQIDALDSQLIDILSQRMEVCRQIGRYKQEHSMPVLQAARLDAVMQSSLQQAQQLGISEEGMRAVLAAIHEESVRQQLAILRGEK